MGDYHLPYTKQMAFFTILSQVRGHASHFLHSSCLKLRVSLKVNVWRLFIDNDTAPSSLKNIVQKQRLYLDDLMLLNELKDT